MALDLAHEIWSELKRHIPTVDRSDAAETIVNVMIDNGFEITEIRDAFTKDTDIKRGKSLTWSYFNLGEYIALVLTFLKCDEAKT